jgi:hypothetical protein
MIDLFQLPQAVGVELTGAGEEMQLLEQFS